MYLYSSCDFLLQGDEVSAFLRCSHLAETQLTDRQTNHQKFTSLTCNDNAVRYNNNYIISHILTTKILTGKQNIRGAPKQCPRFLKVNKNKKGMVNAIKDLLYNIKVHKIQIVILYIKKETHLLNHWFCASGVERAFIMPVLFIFKIWEVFSEPCSFLFVFLSYRKMNKKLHGAAKYQLDKDLREMLNIN